MRADVIPSTAKAAAARCFSRRLQRAVVETLESRTLLSVDLIKDINPTTTAAAAPSSLTDVNGTIYFLAGGQLYKSDGTAGGTLKVSDTIYWPSEFTNVNGTLYFIFNGGLWKSDGTSAGTTFVAAAGGNPKDLTAVGGALY